MDTEAVLLALTGNATELELADYARQLKKSLLAVDGVSRVHLAGAADPEVLIELEDAQAYRLMLAPEQLALTLSQRNVTAPGGGIRVAGQALALRPLAEFTSLDEKLIDGIGDLAQLLPGEDWSIDPLLRLT